MQKAFRILFYNLLHLLYFINWKYFQQPFCISEKTLFQITVTYFQAALPRLENYYFFPTEVTDF